jgi:hypothetical protein
MSIIEICQIVSSFRTYFFKLGNWLDLMTIVPIFYIFISNILKIDQTQNEVIWSTNVVEELQISSAFLILFVSGQIVRIFGSSIYTTIFRKVSSSFFKLLLMYSFLFFTFALSFHILYKTEKNSIVKEEIDRYSESISSNFQKFYDLHEHLFNHETSSDKIQNKLIDVLTNNSVALEFISQKNISLESDFKSKENFKFPYFFLMHFGNSSSAEPDLSMKNVRKVLDHDIIHNQISLTIEEYLDTLVIFANLTRKLRNHVESFARDLENSSIIRPLNLCTVKSKDLKRFFESVAKISQIKDFEVHSMCRFSSESQQNFIENVLKANSHLKLFDLCGKSVDNVEELLKTVLPLKMLQSASFDTFCKLTEALLDEILTNLFGFDELKIQNIKKFCQSSEAPENALKSFFDAEKIDLENICNENQTLTDEMWSNLEAIFKLNVSHRTELEILCDFDEYFYRLVMDSVFPVKFSDNSDLKELCFIDPVVRQKAITEGFVAVKSNEGNKEKFELEVFDDICKINSKDDEIDRILSKRDSGSLSDLISRKKLCGTALTFNRATISLLYDLDKSDVEQLVQLCKTDHNAVDYWMRFLPQKAKIFDSFFDLCKFDNAAIENLVKARNTNINRKTLALMCGLKFSEENASIFENEMFNYVPELLDDFFDWKKICLVAYDTRAEILEVVFEDSNDNLCNIDINQNTDDEEDTLWMKEIEQISVAENLCRLSSTSRFDFLKTSYILTNVTIDFLNKTCAELRSLTTTIMNIQNLTKLLYFNMNEMCEVNRNTNEIFPMFTKVCSNSDFGGQLTTLKEKIDKSSGLKAEKLCIIDSKLLEFFLKSVELDEEEVHEIQRICKKMRRNFMRESSGFVFSIEKLDDLSFLKPVMVYGGLTSAFYDLGVKTIGEMQKFNSLSAENMEKRFQIVYNDDRIRPGSFCLLDKESKVVALREVIGGKNQRIDKIENLCSFGRDQLMRLKHIAFHQNIAGNLEPFKICAISEKSQKEFFRSFSVLTILQASICRSCAKLQTLTLNPSQT